MASKAEESVNRCCHKVFKDSGPYRSFHPSQCSKTATVEHGGKWYCSIHSPEGKQKRNERLQAKWDAERDRNRARQEAEDEKNKRVAAMLLFCEGVDTETIATLAANGETLSKWLAKSDSSSAKEQLSRYRAQIAANPHSKTEDSPEVQQHKLEVFADWSDSSSAGKVGE